jgi:hypothetical protein
MSKDHERDAQPHQADHKPSPGLQALKAQAEKAGLHVTATQESPDGDVVTLTVAVGASLKDFSFAADAATLPALLEAFRNAGGTLPVEPVAEPKAQ